MKKGNLSRKQAIELVGEESVEAVDLLSCQPTSRCQTDGDNDIEYAASIQAIDSEGDECTLTAYYYMDGDWYDQLPEDCDADELCDWTIHGYEVY